MSSFGTPRILPPNPPHLPYRDRNKPATPDPWVLNGHVSVDSSPQPEVGAPWAHKLELVRYYYDGNDRTTVARLLPKDTADELSLRSDLYVDAASNLRDLHANIPYGHGLEAWRTPGERADTLLKLNSVGRFSEPWGELRATPMKDHPGVSEIHTVPTESGQASKVIANCIRDDFAREIVRRSNAFPHVMAMIAKHRDCSRNRVPQSVWDIVQRETGELLEKWVDAPVAPGNESDLNALRAPLTPPATVAPAKPLQESPEL